MPEDEKLRFVEALKHWAEAVDAIRAREHTEAIAQVEELEKDQLKGIPCQRAGEASRREAQELRQMQKAQRGAGLCSQLKIHQRTPAIISQVTTCAHIGVGAAGAAPFLPEL